MNLFAQIRKVDEEKRLVFGRAAEEVIDKAEEIMDYASSKPHFQKWSEDIAKDTGGKNLGNVRAMHGKVAAGMLKGIDFDDANLTIDVCAHIVDDAEWKKVTSGVYTGFSMGGSYVGEKKVEKMDGRDITRYTARPSEISLVDRPCIPTATFFEVQKADGSLHKVDFKAPAAAADDVTVDGTPEQVAALGKALNDAGLNLADALAMVQKAMPDFIKDKVDAKKKKDGKADDKDAPAADDKKDAKAADKVQTPAELKKMEQSTLRKSMWSCSSLASVIGSLQSLAADQAYMAFSSGDDSGIASKLKACIAMCGGVLKDMVDAEIADAVADPILIELSEKTGALAKFEGDPLVELLKAETVLAKAGARHSAADAERLKNIHDAAVGMGAACGDAAKAAPAGELEKLGTDGKDALQKMVADAVASAIAPLQKAFDAANQEIVLLKAQPAPARVSLRAVAKVDDSGASSDAAAVAKAAPIVDLNGEKHEAAGLIKSLHLTGGAPLHLRK